MYWKKGLYTSIASLLLGLSQPSLAVNFSSRELDQRSMIAVAIPVDGGNFYQLLILRQLNNRQPCWQEIGQNPTQVELSLLKFDFTGICTRSTDTNGYSVRMGGEDLGWNYDLRLIKGNNDLTLVAYPVKDKNRGSIVIGHTQGLIPNTPLKITLDPQWRMSQRTYNNRPLEHIYLNTDQSLSTTPTIANLPLTNPNSTPSLPTSVTNTSSQNTTNVIRVNPKPNGETDWIDFGVTSNTNNLFNRNNSNHSSLNTPLPSPNSFSPSTITPPSPNALSNNNFLPPPPTPNRILPTLSTLPTPPPPVSNTNTNVVATTPSPVTPVPPTSSINYRVIIPVTSVELPNQVKGIVPDAFRTVYNGQWVMQAGSFSDQTKANDLQQLLTRNGFSAIIVNLQ